MVVIFYLGRLCVLSYTTYYFSLFFTNNVIYKLLDHCWLIVHSWSSAAFEVRSYILLHLNSYFNFYKILE